MNVQHRGMIAKTRFESACHLYFPQTLGLCSSLHRNDTLTLIPLSVVFSIVFQPLVTLIERTWVTSRKPRRKVGPLHSKGLTLN